MLALTNSDRSYHDRSALSFAERLATREVHSEAMAAKGYIYHSTGDQLREALEGYKWELGGENVGVGGRSRASRTPSWPANRTGTSFAGCTSTRPSASLAPTIGSG